MKLPADFERVVELFRKLPSVGEKSATRYALALSRWDKERLSDFSNSIEALSNINYCTNCGLFSEQLICSLCQDVKRGESQTVCVVESIPDAMAIERGGHFKGRFHVLGGVLNPLQGIGPNEINIAALVKRVRSGEVKSLVLAVNPSVEGDATCAYIKQVVGVDANVERIGFGIPMGGSLEYLDPMTISKAIENRKRI